MTGKPLALERASQILDEGARKRLVWSSRQATINNIWSQPVVAEAWPQSTAQGYHGKAEKLGWGTRKGPSECRSAKTRALGITPLFCLAVHCPMNTQLNKTPRLIFQNRSLHHYKKYLEVVLRLLLNTAKVISFSLLTCVQINHQCKIPNAWRNAMRFIFAPGENQLELQ